MQRDARDVARIGFLGTASLRWRLHCGTQCHNSGRMTMLTDLGLRAARRLRPRDRHGVPVAPGWVLHHVFSEIDRAPIISNSTETTPNSTLRNYFEKCCMHVDFLSTNALAGGLKVGYWHPRGCARPVRKADLCRGNGRSDARGDVLGAATRAHPLRGTSGRDAARAQPGPPARSPGAMGPGRRPRSDPHRGQDAGRSSRTQAAGARPAPPPGLAGPAGRGQATPPSGCWHRASRRRCARSAR